MTLALTAPDRIAMMLLDAHDDVRETYNTFQANIDSIRRPAWDIEVGEAQYDPTAASVEHFLENYILTLIGAKFVSGMTSDDEIQARSIAEATWVYFAQRSQLQFSNLRGKESAPLRALAGVEWARVTNRNAISLMQRGDVEQFWGCQFTLTIHGARGFDEVWVP